VLRDPIRRLLDGAGIRKRRAAKLPDLECCRQNPSKAKRPSSLRMMASSFSPGVFADHLIRVALHT
jgi:hypothetical protein